MSLTHEEARSLDDAFQFLMDLSSGAEKRIPSETRKRARRIARHFPLAPGPRWIEGQSTNPEPKHEARPPSPLTQIGRK